jgi:steroid delta-isomerase-like uncharacterized protein
MPVSRKQRRILREHIKAESEHDVSALLDGMTANCFNDVVCVAKPFVGPAKVAERYLKHWEGFPDFRVRVRRFLCAEKNCVVTENEWSGTHRGMFLGLPPTGKRVRVRAIVAWHFKAGKLRGETVFFDMGSILKQIGGHAVVPARKRLNGGKSRGSPTKPRGGRRQVARG